MPNALANTASPYLQQHADNPVAWLPWEEAAFAKARAEDKPVFLSIGYATCHWCHVMAHEAFESPEVAAYLNEHFVCIKVDREERPDLDRVYMAYVQSVTGQGGWPLSVFLTPDRSPFFGGTYFPVEDRHGRPGFMTLLQALQQAWVTRREEVLLAGQRSLEALAASAARVQSVDTPGGLTLDDLARHWGRAWSVLEEAQDREHGGFGGAPKFPQPGFLRFLVRYGLATGDDAQTRAAQELVDKSLSAMARGGIHDQVGGGFHRYSVDAAWHLPHFEKMLYDQAQLALAYLEHWQAVGDERHAWLARDILLYCFSRLRDASGAFCSAEDADSPVDRAPGATVREGAFYVWRASELRELLEDGDHALAVAMFSIRDGGNVDPDQDPHGELTDRNVLSQAAPLGELATRLGLAPADVVAAKRRILSTLALARSRRPSPFRDDKVVTAWNGLMLSSLCKAALCDAAPFQLPLSAGLHAELSADAGGAEPSLASFCREAAVRCAEALVARVLSQEEDRLLRSWCGGVAGPGAVVSDHAFLAQGFLDLYQVTLEYRWLALALWVQERMERLFALPSGGYSEAPAGTPDLVVNLTDTYEGAEPGASGVAVMNLVRLAALFDREDLRARAQALVSSFGGILEEHPHSLPSLLLALEWLVAWPPSLQVVAPLPPPAEALAFATKLFRKPGPPTVLLGVNAETPAALLGERSWLAELARRSQHQGAQVYSCHDNACQAPVPLGDFAP